MSSKSKSKLSPYVPPPKPYAIKKGFVDPFQVDELDPTSILYNPESIVMPVPVAVPNATLSVNSGPAGPKGPLGEPADHAKIKAEVIEELTHNQDGKKVSPTIAGLQAQIEELKKMVLKAQNEAAAALGAQQNLMSQVHSLHSEVNKLHAKLKHHTHPVPGLMVDGCLMPSKETMPSQNVDYF